MTKQSTQPTSQSSTDAPSVHQGILTTIHPLVNPEGFKMNMGVDWEITIDDTGTYIKVLGIFPLKPEDAKVYNLNPMSPEGLQNFITFVEEEMMAYCEKQGYRPQSMSIN